MNKTRCAWCLSDPLYITYHDKEWGVPMHDEKTLFEFIILEGMQAGLNWFTILKKREAMRKAFHQFDVEKLAVMKDSELNILLNNADIIRHRLKIASTRKNAQALLVLKEKGIHFSDWIWQFTDGKTIHNMWEKHEQIPTETQASKNMARELKKRGFSFVGSTTCYAFMQATGMVNDHLVSCYRHSQLTK